MTVMFDSVDVGAIPSDAPAVAGYVAGRFPTYPELVKRFPKAHKLSIAVASTQDAQCLDVEPGDSTPALAPGWVKRQIARGVKRPVVYASRDTMPAVIRSLEANGIPRSQVRLWSAHFTGHAHICSPSSCNAPGFTADATQWTDRALGRNLDESLCATGFFGGPSKATLRRRAQLALWKRRVTYRRHRRDKWAKLLTRAESMVRKLS